MRDQLPLKKETLDYRILTGISLYIFASLAAIFDIPTHHSVEIISVAISVETEVIVFGI